MRQILYTILTLFVLTGTAASWQAAGQVRDDRMYRIVSPSGLAIDNRLNPDNLGNLFLSPVDRKDKGQLWRLVKYADAYVIYSPFTNKSFDVVNAGGETWLGILGSAIATFAVVLPSFILMLTVSRMLIRYGHTRTVESVFMGLRPAVVGLIASAAIILMNTENFGSPETDLYHFVISVVIFLSVFIATLKKWVHPIMAIIIAGVAGFFLF